MGEDPPAEALNALQSPVSRLRKVLGDPWLSAETTGGYRLRLDPGEVDAHRFEELAARGRRELAAGHFGAAPAALTEALGHEDAARHWQISASAHSGLLPGRLRAHSVRLR